MSKLVKEISIVWKIDDVLAQAKEDGIFSMTEEDASNVLQLIERKHDADIGINWSIISMAIRAYYNL